MIFQHISRGYYDYVEDQPYSRKGLNPHLGLRLYCSLTLLAHLTYGVIMIIFALLNKNKYIMANKTGVNNFSRVHILEGSGNLMGNYTNII